MLTGHTQNKTLTGYTQIEDTHRLWYSGSSGTNMYGIIWSIIRITQSTITIYSKYKHIQLQRMVFPQMNAVATNFLTMHVPVATT